MKSSSAKPAPRTTTDWLALTEHLLQAAFVALLFLAVLVPSDTPADRGMFVAQAAGWTLLALGVSLWLVWRHRGMAWEIVDTLAVAYLAWTAAAMLAVWGVGDMRAAFNSFFQSTAFVLVLLLGRQLIRSNEQRRAVLTAVLALGSAMALLGILQYLIFDPMNRAEIKAHPELLLEPLGIWDHHSPEARRALDRALSPEPLGTFTLTNSLACFLTPWLIVLAASGAGFQPARRIGFQPVREETGYSWKSTLLRQARSLPHLVLLAVCLWLTHSRMSILALLAGVALLVGVRFRTLVRWQRWVAGVAAVLLLSATVFGALLLGSDSNLLAQAAASAQYRLEYWQSTWAMIGDHWLLGVGPGNFKSVYPQYKLPQASEEIGDPHNFILEVWSTAGTFGVLLLAALLVAVFWDGGKGKREKGIGNREKESENEESGNSKAHFQFSNPESPIPNSGPWILGGAAVGFLLVTVAGPMYSTAYPWVLAPGCLLFFFVLRPLITDDLLRGAALPIAAITMLTNLLAAGGIGFPGVALPLALLLALISLGSLSPASSFSTSDPVSLSSSPFAPTPSRFPPLLALIGSLALYVACYVLCYLPVFRADSLEVEEAMAADPFSPEVCRQLARSELELLLHGSPEALETMEEALDEWIRRDARSYASHQGAGDARLAAYRSLKRPELLQEAIENYEAAAARYPNFSFMPAQLAWARHVAGDDAGAREAAEEALRLDELCPHADKKLKQQTLRDPGLTDLERVIPLDTKMRSLVKAKSASTK